MATDHDAQIRTSSSPPIAPPADPPPLDNPTTTTATANPPKRQRRPSVRLGEIGGDPPHDSSHRRPNKSWRFHKHPSFAAKTSKTRPLTNLVNGGADPNLQDSVEISDDYADFSHRKPKTRKPTKRARTNWNQFDTSAANNNNGGVIESTSFLQEDNYNNNDEFRELEGEEQQSPNNSAENMRLQCWGHRRRNGVHVNEVNSLEKSSEGNLEVKEWLIGLGLGRYAPVFEIHEVDNEVLPMLTLDDLKDMGINAVGSRRKMYTSILKLRCFRIRWKVASLFMLTYVQPIRCW